MSKEYEKLTKALADVRKKTDFVPKVALILGSGLGDYAESMKVVTTLSYNEIEGFPVSTVQGHKGQFVFGYVEDVPVVCMQGRVHYYEGYSTQDVVMPIRLMKLMGAEILFLTNAAGGLHNDMKAGDLMMITDQIACFAPNPLIGPNVEELGTRFPDMTDLYTPAIQDIIRQEASALSIDLKEGIYCQLTGPSFESPAEVRLLQMLGGGSVGMSTAIEAITARHCGMKICGISCICNLGAGLSKSPLSHEEVQKAGLEAAPKFKALVTAVISKLG
ncbi:MAG: purine-nucleoside phosphorylase [Lachnospiraceae bacterium]|nr:purine-nucleoside phosphorylase [Candidatus Merdinaster equi]